MTERPDGSLKDEWRYVGGAEFYICHSGSRAGLERQRLRLTDDVGQVAVIETRNHVDDGTARRLVRYQFPNHLGSASLELDQNAAIVTYEEFTPFGSTAYQAVRGQTDAPKRSRFAGKERDEESGLSYFGARYYASWLGRWTSCDRVRRTGQLYAFVGNNPIGHVDPDGNDEKPPPRMGSYTTPGNRGDIGTLVHTLVLTAIQLRLSVLGLVAVTEATTKPDGSKNINSTNSGRVDLAILVPDHAHPGSFIADVYDLKPGNVDQFYTYRSEVDHYTEHFQSNIAGLNISSARLGHTLRGLEKIEPRIFEPIRFRYGEYEITITPKLARDVNNRVVDGVLTYSLGVQKGDNVERFERNTRISINQTADAQAHGIVRASFMAGGMINLANAVAQFLSFGGALVYAALTGAAAGGTAGGGAGVVYRVAGNSTMRISGVEIAPNATVRVATGGVRVASEVVQAVEQAELQEVLVDTASELGAKVTANVLRIPLP